MELDGRLAIHDVTAEVVSRLAVIIPTAAVSLRDMPSVEIATVEIDYCTVTISTG